jgi:branched-chain amino acid transport system ATP-binding protein
MAGICRKRVADLCRTVTVGYCPEERGIFASLTCEENLLLPPDLAPDGMSLGDIYGMFPNLLERKNSPGARLSGGEQQMLALARILRSGARLLLLDEISEGLAPVIVQHLARVIDQLKSLGYTIVLVEQNFHFVAALADRMLVVEHGEIVLQVDADKLEEHRSELEQLLGV